MNKKFFIAFIMIAGFFLIGCNKDDKKQEIQLLSPDDDVSIDLNLSGTDKITFSWTKIEDATGYVLKFSPEETGLANTSVTYNVNSESYDLSRDAADIMLGAYTQALSGDSIKMYWTVESASPDAGIKAQARSFTVTRMTTPVTPYLTVSAITLSFPDAPEGTKSIDIDANTAWNIDITQTDDWLTANPMSGSAKATVVFTAEENTDETRTATVKITGAGVDAKTITVTQSATGASEGQPYSSLSPEEQKIKLENESLELLRLGNAAKTSPAIEALQNLDNLLANSSLDFGEKAIHTYEDIFEFADLYRVITWNRQRGEWDVTASSTEFKVVFPATKGATSNNATFSATSVKSQVSFTYKYERCDWDCEEVEEVYFLPSSVNATLTIDNTEAAKYVTSAEYNGNNRFPVQFEHTLTTSDPYVHTANFQKGANNSIEVKTIYDGVTMFEARIQTGSKIDDLLDLFLDGDYDEDNLYDLADDAFGYMRIMGDLAIVYSGDVQNVLRGADDIQDEYEEKKYATTSSNNWYTNPNRYIQMGQIEKDRSEKLAALYNKYVKGELISRNENGYKIADLVWMAEPQDACWDNFYWYQSLESWVYDWDRPARKLYDYYTMKPYLKFADGTSIEAEVYFSNGFDKIDSEWRNFVDAFDR